MMHKYYVVVTFLEYLGTWLIMRTYSGTADGKKLADEFAATNDKYLVEERMSSVELV